MKQKIIHTGVKMYATCSHSSTVAEPTNLYKKIIVIKTVEKVIWKQNGASKTYKKS